MAPKLQPAAAQPAAAPAANPCTLTPVPDCTNRFTAVAGSLVLVVKNVQGTTYLDCISSKITDITDSARPNAVDHTATNVSLSFKMQSGKTYLLNLAFVQIVDPYNSSAQLNEASGQTIDTIDVTNLFPGYFVEVA